ncbi:MAG: hypothetical protein NC823_00285, partial [Candidatus Omnitrophica bacterium]|nr:hypothetical protein [Candidatus Omnitrophota bacterium]
MPKKNFPPWFFYFALVTAFFWLSLGYWRYFDDDEFQHIHFAWLLSQGLVPFRDFFEHHIPFYHLLVSPLMHLPSGSYLIFIFRFLSLACAFGTLGLIFSYCRRQDGQWPAAGATLMLAWAPIFAIKMVEARPEAPAILSFTLAAVTLLENRGALSRARAFLVGFCLACTVLFSAKYLVVVFGLVLLVFLTEKFSTCLLTLAGAAAGCFPLLGYLAVTQSFSEFVQSVVVNNLFWKHSFSPQGYLFETFTQSPALVGLAFGGLLGGLFFQKPERGLVTLAGAGGVFLAIFLLPEPYRQSFLPLFPLMALAGSFMLSLILSSLEPFGRKELALSSLIFFGSLPGVVQLGKEFFQSNREDLETMRLVEKIDPSAGPVLDGRGLMFYRAHLGFHACMHRGIMAMVDLEKYSAEVITELEKRKFPVVIFDYRVKDLPVALQDFIKNHYLPVENTAVYVPGLNIDRSLLTLAGTEVSIPITGEYQITWIGQGLAIDHRAVENNSILYLTEGNHHF